LTNLGQPVVDAPAQRPRHVERLGLDPAERTEERQYADLDPLAVHPAEMEIDVIESFGERCVASSGGPPMGMHVDHRWFLHGKSGSLTPTAARRKVQQPSHVDRWHQP